MTIRVEGQGGPGQSCVTVHRSNGSGNSCGGLAGTRPSAQHDAVVIQATTGVNGTALLHMLALTSGAGATAGGRPSLP